jgi:hypothetical protein
MSCSVEIEEVESESRNRGPGGHRRGGPEAVCGHGAQEFAKSVGKEGCAKARGMLAALEV